MKKRGLGIPKSPKFQAPATLWKRILAFILDLVIIDLVLLFPLRRLLEKIVPLDMGIQETYQYLTTNTQVATALTFITFTIGVLALLYFSLLELKLNQTIGKMVFKIYVISINKELNFWQCIGRNLFALPFFPFIILWVVDPIFMFMTKDNRRLSEILTKTKTIEHFNLQKS